MQNIPQVNQLIPSEYEDFESVRQEVLVVVVILCIRSNFAADA
jgi:hypothetical protein